MAWFDESTNGNCVLSSSAIQGHISEICRTKVYINDAPYPDYDRNRQGEYNFTCEEKI
jgi:hypothetical protein